jgi:hypothetical protein
MSASRVLRRGVRWTAVACCCAAAAYVAYVGTAWYRYGRGVLTSRDDTDTLLDEFMPAYEVAERHQIHVRAPAEITLRSAMEMDLQGSRLVRAIFRTREVVLGATPDTGRRRHALLAEMQSIGWRVLAERPGREIVVGAVTQPWQPNVTFRGLSPDAFKAFHEPDHVKIAWTLRADPVGAAGSIFRTETRVATTDAAARAKFRWYWARFSPGIILIRRVLNRQLKREAEGRAGATAVH